VAGGAALLLAVAVGAALVLLSGNLLRRPLEGLISHATGREVRITGDVHAQWLRRHPRLSAEDIQVANADWAGKEDLADIGKVTVALRWGPLLRGKVAMVALAVDGAHLNLQRQADGRANWAGPGAGGVSLPPVRHLRIRDGRVRLADAQHHIDFDGTVEARESQRQEVPFRLEGKGRLNRKAFELTLTGGSLQAAESDEAYPFTLAARSGATEVTAKGTMGGPLVPDVLDAALTVKGDDLADLYSLTGLTLPNTPPYRLAGRLRRDGPVVRFEKFDGTVGRSDLAGNLSVDTGGDRPKLTAEMASRKLNLPDLAALLGAELPGQPAAPGKGAGPARVLPDAPLDVARVRAMDADVRFKAAEVTSAYLPVRGLAVKVDLDHGVLKLDPLEVVLPQGRLSGSAGIDARKDVPEVAVDVKLNGARVEDFFAKLGKQAALEGPLLARAKLQGRGKSVHQAAASADGTVTVVMPHGTVRQAFAELLGIDVATGLGLLLTKNQQQTEVRCAVANFNASHGVLEARHVVFDTGVVVARGAGEIDLADESLRVRLQGKPKTPELLRVAAPIVVGGTLGHPTLGVDAGKAAAQVGAAAVLAAALPPLAILPFVDPGLAKDANCAALLGQAKAEGAPLKKAGAGGNRQ
jgi:uncharacterized protein involved in outer membrane biogenesis